MSFFNPVPEVNALLQVLREQVLVGQVTPVWGDTRPGLTVLLEMRNDPAAPFTLSLIRDDHSGALWACLSRAAGEGYIHRWSEREVDASLLYALWEVCMCRQFAGTDIEAGLFYLLNRATTG